LARLGFVEFSDRAAREKYLNMRGMCAYDLFFAILGYFLDSGRGISGTSSEVLEHRPRLTYFGHDWGGEPGMLNGEGIKPKWMRWRTFERLAAEHAAFVGKSLAAVALRFGIKGSGASAP
jgi:hypothetical protein